jgi:hypothetical protein
MSLVERNRQEEETNDVSLAVKLMIGVRKIEILAANNLEHGRFSTQK